MVVGNRTVIPVARVGYAFGGGGAKGDALAESGGGAGHVSARPCGALEITPEGTRYIAFDDWRRTGIALALGFVVGAAVVSFSGERRAEVGRHQN